MINSLFNVNQEEIKNILHTVDLNYLFLVFFQGTCASRNNKKVFFFTRTQLINKKKTPFSIILCIMRIRKCDLAKLFAVAQFCTLNSESPAVI